MSGNDTQKDGDYLLRERALRFAGVVLDAPGSVVEPRPEAVSQALADSRLNDRVDRFALRLNEPR